MHGGDEGRRGERGTSREREDGLDRGTEKGGRGKKFLSMVYFGGLWQRDNERSRSVHGA
jgi:hypothetical protein